MNAVRTPNAFCWLLEAQCIHQADIISAEDGFFFVSKSLSDILAEKEILDFPDSSGQILPCNRFFDDWFLYAVPNGPEHTYGLLKLREQEHDTEDGSPADGCGLKAGDIITKFANRDVTSMEKLQNILSTKKAEEEIEMTVQRNTEKGDYEEIKLKVVLGAKKDMPEQDKTEAPKQESNYPNEMYPEEYFDPFSEFFNN